jgi:hypothetical protein
MSIDVAALIQALNETDEHERIEAKAGSQAGRIGNETYRELNGVETLKASQDRIRLRKAGLLSMEGQSTATHYEPTEKLLDTESTPQGELPFDNHKPETTQAEAQTSKLEGEALTTRQKLCDGRPCRQPFRPRHSEELTRRGISSNPAETGPTAVLVRSVSVSTAEIPTGRDSHKG